MQDTSTSVMLLAKMGGVAPKRTEQSSPPEEYSHFHLQTPRAYVVRDCAYQIFDTSRPPLLFDEPRRRSDPSATT
jgi:hypothetical protein